MAQKNPITLPVAFSEYDKVNESLLRRQLEQAIQNIENEISYLKSMRESITSKSVRRHQFLLMGAKQ
jgi:hypothetical protein